MASQPRVPLTQGPVLGSLGIAPAQVTMKEKQVVSIRPLTLPPCLVHHLIALAGHICFLIGKRHNILVAQRAQPSFYFSSS